MDARRQRGQRRASAKTPRTCFIVFPAMLIVSRFVYRGSVCTTFIWLGLLIYIVYRFVLYAFFIHFGPLFPVYVAVLGLSAYALFGSVSHMDLNEVSRLLATNQKTKLASTSCSSSCCSSPCNGSPRSCPP